MPYTLTPKIKQDKQEDNPCAIPPADTEPQKAPEQAPAQEPEQPHGDNKARAESTTLGIDTDIYNLLSNIAFHVGLTNSASTKTRSEERPILKMSFLGLSQSNGKTRTGIAINCNSNSKKHAYSALSVAVYVLEERGIFFTNPIPCPQEDNCHKYSFIAFLKDFDKDILKKAIDIDEKQEQPNN